MTGASMARPLAIDVRTLRQGADPVEGWERREVIRWTDRGTPVVRPHGGVGELYLAAGSWRA